MVRTGLTRAFFFWVSVAIVTACANPGADDGQPVNVPADPNKSHSNTGPATTDSSWVEVWEQVNSCGTPHCAGEHGFGINVNGDYYVGATADSATHHGTLGMAEQETVTKAVLAVVAENLSGEARCSSTNPSPGVAKEYVIDIRSSNGGTRIPVYEVTQAGKRACIRGDSGNAQNLRDALAPVIQRYDPAPVPSPTPSPSGHPLPWPFPTPHTW
jgi:hypothetical protein